MANSAKPIKLGIGLPLTDDKVYTQFLDSWIQMETPDRWVYCRPQFKGPIDAVRNHIVEEALDWDCTHLLMLDTDQEHPPDVVMKLLSHDLPIVGAKVYRRYPPYDPILLRGSIPIFGHVSDEECESGELVEVDATGCGALMCKMDVFLNIPRPWFKWEMPKIDDVDVMIGEDFYFCNKAKEAGYKIYVDTSLEVSHLTIMEVNQAAYKLYSKLGKMQAEGVGAEANRGEEEEHNYETFPPYTGKVPKY